MAKWMINWDCGYGPSYEVVEADSRDEAEKIAYESWREDAESNASYGAEEYTKELAEGYAIE